MREANSYCNGPCEGRRGAVEVAGCSTPGVRLALVYATPEVPFAATRMGRVAPGEVQHGGPRRQWAGRGCILKAEQTGLCRWNGV